MPEAPRKPNDAPVTWGELREVVELLGQLGLLSSTYAALSATPSDMRDDERFRKTAERVREVGAILSDRFIKGPE